VSYRLGRSRFLAGLLCVLWSSGAAVTVAWWQAAAASDPGPAGGLACLLLAGAWAVGGWRRLPQGHLSWDEQGWTWLSASCPGGSAVAEVGVLLDLQRLILLRLRRPDHAHWLVWADAASDPGHWLDFRRAVKAHARGAGAPSQAAGRDAQP
jgi:hypothetical protein